MNIFSIFETKDSVVKPTFKNRHNIDFFDILSHFIVLCLIETCRSQNHDVKMSSLTLPTTTIQQSGRQH